MPWQAGCFIPMWRRFWSLKYLKLLVAGSQYTVYGCMYMTSYGIIWHHMAEKRPTYGPHRCKFFQERDGMKVMDAGEVGEIVQGGVQVGIGNLSGSSSIHLTYSNLM